MTDSQEIEYDDPGSDALAPGSKLLSGQYEILRYLSSGGFGITYLAKDSLNRTVVIKECFPEAFCSRVNRTVRARTKNYVEDFRSIVKLFIREAHALSRLDHPSVVGVHQVFEDNETAYMALDLIDGQDLLEIIETGEPALKPEDIRKLTLKLLDAISHVHAQDLLHRDISPDNILVDRTGHPVLIDFGAAREEASRKSRVLSSVLVVKDGYSPQEFYVAGSRQQPCSDLYALAATLSHLISGTPPPSSQMRLAALASKQPDPFEPMEGRFPGYDAAFLKAIDQAMSIAPDQRLQSADDWTLMIDHSKRVEMARAKAQKDKTIDETVMNLVRAVKEDNNLAGEESRPKRQAQADSAPETRNPGAAPAVEDLRSATLTGKDLLSGPADDDQAETTRPSPYIRVKSKAVQTAQQALAARTEPRPPLTRRQVVRAATAPVVFTAYFFYGYTVLQHEAVHAATIQPIVEFGKSLAPDKKPEVKILRMSGS